MQTAGGKQIQQRKLDPYNGITDINGVTSNCLALITQLVNAVSVHVVLRDMWQGRLEYFCTLAQNWYEIGYLCTGQCRWQ